MARVKKLPRIDVCAKPITRAPGAGEPKDDLFPRCQHPDTRTNAEWLRIMEQKQLVKTPCKPKLIINHHIILNTN